MDHRPIPLSDVIRGPDVFVLAGMNASLHSATRAPGFAFSGCLLRPPRAAATIRDIARSPSPRSMTHSDDTGLKPDSAALIVAIAGEDRAAFAQLFNYFAPRVKAMLLRSGLDPARAEDIAQETLLLVWRKADKFDPAGASAAAWIYTIARNLRIDIARRDKRGARLVEAEGEDIPDPGQSAFDTLSEVEVEERVRSAMSALSAEQLKVVTLSFFESKPHPEIAETLGIPLGTVKSRLRLAMQHLRRILDDFA